MQMILQLLSDGSVTSLTLVVIAHASCFSCTAPKVNFLCDQANPIHTITPSRFSMLFCTFDPQLSAYFSRGDRVTHVKLSGRDGVHHLPTGEEFISIAVLVDYLIKTPNLFHERDGTPVEVVRPANIPPCEDVIDVGHDRFFHVGISGAEAEELLQNEPNGTFLVRESLSIAGEYAFSVKSDESVLHVRIYHDVSTDCLDKAAILS